MAERNESNQLSDFSSLDSVGILPPRKRAKTDEEKEQRRVERILRNRRAAHASREKKRRHVEHLEAYVDHLENSIKTFEANHDKFVSIQNELFLRLARNGIDFSDIDLSIEKPTKVSRPDDLDLTASHSAKKQSTASKKSKSKSEIPSPSFEDDMSSEEEDEEEEQEKSVATVASKVKVIQMESQSLNSKKRKAEEEYLSPPGSTSPSKLRLDDEELIKQEYTSLFEDHEELFNKTSSLELFKQNDPILNPFNKEDDLLNFKQYIKTEDDLMKLSNTNVVDSNGNYESNPMEDLCAFNVVHHPAVMINYY
ncbi:hypothetical protein CANARDRAFT_209154 [[Candida] arabinofermentans NRRL YB-2248]|uniref:BZIP domain-containing protein n=1 Tax=[Candida] arabinofermentans NRRL YB-2248 TaxID=983967 RepID=A0A1E4SVN2_9ASCO|nr:hypothetical protein CANARDRAFT_209154 [[Candida] arabinofermentans NRRL YB-2248]